MPKFQVSMNRTISQSKTVSIEAEDDAEADAKATDAESDAESSTDWKFESLEDFEISNVEEE